METKVAHMGKGIEWIISAFPDKGKIALILQWALDSTQHQIMPAIIVSHWVSSNEVVCYEAKVNWYRNKWVF